MGRRLKLRRSRNSMIQMPQSIVKNGKGGKGSMIYHGGNWQGNGTVWQSCGHKGDKIIYEQDGKKLYGASGSSLREYSGAWDLIIDLAGNITRSQIDQDLVKVGTSERFRDLQQWTHAKHKIPSELLLLDWPDMGVPNATYEFWVQLWDRLPEKTVVACQGGHGRTGTCLAALIIISGIDYYTAVDLVRAEHCDKAIETVTQERYLHAIYVETLKRQISAAVDCGDQAEAIDLGADLAYAEQHVPDYKTTSASKETKPINGNVAEKPDTDPVELAVTDHEWDTNQLQKRVNGHDYWMQCNEKTCTLTNCMTRSHQRWVRWDLNDSEMMEYQHGW